MVTKKKKTKSRTSKKPVAKKSSVAKKKKPSKAVAKKKAPAKKKTAAKKRATVNKAVAKKASKKKSPTSKMAAKKNSSARKKSPAKKKAGARKLKKKLVLTRSKARGFTKKKVAPVRVAFSRSAPLNGTSLAGINYRALETEITKLTDLLQTIRKKNKLVKKSLAYLEKEQRKVAKQIQEAKKYLTQLKNRGIKVLREFPDNAEEIFYQLKGEITRISRRLGIR